MLFVYAVIDPTDGYYDLEKTFENPVEAIRISVFDHKDVAVLDAMSLEYYGKI